MATVVQEEPATAAQTQRRINLFVWELPVRVTHWVNVTSILILSITGYFIASPPVFATTTTFLGIPGTATFMLGTIRFTHFVTAFVFTISVLYRLAWAFVGNQYARWDQFLPVRRYRRQDMRRMLRYYTFFRREAPPQIGHNPLAGMAYVALYVLFAVQIFTGFALYALAFRTGFWPFAFGWVTHLFGAPGVRMVHDLVMYLIIAFTIHHVYSAILIDMEERSGLVSSIVTGTKALTPESVAQITSQEALARQPRARRKAARLPRGKAEADAGEVRPVDGQ